MGLAEYSVYPDVDNLMAEIKKYDLYEHVVELEAYGLTIVPPEKMHTSADFIARLRDAIIKTCEQRNGCEIGDYRTAKPAMTEVAKNSWDLLEEDEVFVEAAINPVNIALVRWLLGQSAIFSGQTWIIKGEGSDGIGLHSDSHGVPPGAGQIAHMCNASWICTDYASAADGPTVFVPGSHHYGRATLPHEADRTNTPYRSVPLIAKAGSLAIWNGATWHASEPRTNPGLRVTLVQNYMRSYMRPQHNYEQSTSPQLLEKYPELAKLIGKSLYPYDDSQNPDYTRVASFMQAGTDPFA
ncbi:MAG: ectoine hydroxylase-related dioxygenase (phytanoyl-CoA dioxygenase family) [Limisphaerales bacterium]|jgi:ectoine hydroxylase-related dioxygenase (phytanoyl-CoA dioxygenase family)